MKIYSVTDSCFKEYGRVIKGLNIDELMKKMEEVAELPNNGTAYVPSCKKLEKLEIMDVLSNCIYGGMPIQIGYCIGYNTKLNCLEYHKDSEVNIGNHDFILLLAKKSEIVNGTLDTEKVKAFLVPKNTPVEVYSTSLHYAPCEFDPKVSFKVIVVLPKGTNTEIEKDKYSLDDGEYKYLFARNKWLLAHKDSSEAKNGAEVGLVGDNLDISK